jgi:hypothetical protein
VSYTDIERVGLIDSILDVMVLITNEGYAHFNNDLPIKPTISILIYLLNPTSLYDTHLLNPL